MAPCVVTIAARAAITHSRGVARPAVAVKIPASETPAEAHSSFSHRDKTGKRRPGTANPQWLNLR
jgi:hypothetical protein